MTNKKTHIIELRIIGGMLIDSTFISTIPLKPDDFALTSLREIHTAMLEMVAQGKTIDLVTVAEHLEKKTGKGFLSILERAYESARIGISNTPALGDALRNHSIQRKARYIGQQLAESGDVDLAIRELMNITTISRRDSYSISEAVRNLYNEIERGDKGVTTGLS
ncbi:MAG: DnaB-like helicase N-terminal domain-containing protein, partial [Candidatus Thiodiazotropha endolucinida]